MDHETALITTIVSGLVLAFIFGFTAQKLRLSPLVGYLLAGILIGPHTPGFIGDTVIAQQMAEIGIILLMFGVGMHFSLRDLKSVQAIALPGAIVQMGVATILGMLLGRMAGFPLIESLIFGFALSAASTVVLLRALEDRNELDSKIGKIAVGWLIVEDIVMVLALVMIPALLQAGGEDGANIIMSLAWTTAKIVLFIVLMIVVGMRVLPRFLLHIQHTSGGEMFTLAVIATAMGFAFIAYKWFGASFALGAFLAGLVLGSSPVSHKAAKRSLPLRDIFSVLFFVSVGMLFNPAILLEKPMLVLAVLMVIMLGKSLAALAITKLFAQDLKTGLTIAASLAQIGEFSFILAGLGMKFGVLSGIGNDLILGGALLSIALNPFVFLLLDRLKPAAIPRSI